MLKYTHRTSRCEVHNKVRAKSFYVKNGQAYKLANDKKLPEQEFYKIINNPDDLIKYALQKVEALYSFSTFKTQLIEVVAKVVKT